MPSFLEVDEDRVTTRLEALAALAAVGYDRSELEIIRAGADIAQKCTRSQIAYLHFLNEDEETIELGTWSSDTLKHCSAVYDRHYPISHAGIWADSARTRRPVLHNDYAAVAERRGLPQGHAHLARHLGVPIDHEGRVRLLIGVGNKEEPYDDVDVTLVQMVGRRTWEQLRGRREMERLQNLEERFRQLQRHSAASALEYDRDDDRLTFDEQFASIFRTSHHTEVPDSLHQLLHFIAEGDREVIRQFFESAPEGTTIEREVRAVRATGEPFAASLRASIRLRDVGHGALVIGVLQDLEEHARLENLKHQAETDTLTELPNRRRLQIWFDGERRERRREGDGWAFHYIDLDEFKPVNDTYGHAAGDEVLRTISRRLVDLVRREDLVVRLGGDEFAIVQEGVADAEGAKTLAEKVVAECRRPMLVVGHEVQVGASVGVAVCLHAGWSLKEAAMRADRALYEAKHAGRGRASLYVESG